jgi:dihydroflavonol-4-reductase
VTLAPHCFLTGATGFLGAELFARLQRRGARLHLFVRDAARAKALEARGARVHLGDLRDAGATRRALESCARESGGAFDVVNNAALISYKRADRADQVAINVEGTRTMADESARLGARRFCHVSSVVAVGSSEDGRPIDETARWNLGRCRVDYADTKRAAEEHVLALSSKLDCVSANPGAIFGAKGAGSNTARFLARVARRGAPPVAPPGWLAVVGVEDAAEGVLLALERGRRGERYLLVESNWRTRDLFALAARLSGRRAPLATLPAWVLPPLAALARAVEPACASDLVPPQALTMLGRHLVFDATKARRELGWSPEPFEGVLRRSLAAALESGA